MTFQRSTVMIEPMLVVKVWVQFTKLEALEVVWAIKHHRPYLWSHQCTLHTDHAPVSSMVTLHTPASTCFAQRSDQSAAIGLDPLPEHQAVQLQPDGGMGGHHQRGRAAGLLHRWLRNSRPRAPHAGWSGAATDGSCCRVQPDSQCLDFTVNPTGMML